MLYERLMTLANQHYLEAKAAKMDLTYLAPEALPEICSDQVKALARALAEILEGADTANDSGSIDNLK